MGYADMCITLDGLDPTIRSRTVALHACSFSRPKRVSIRPHKASDAYAYHVRGGHGGVVCTQAGRNLFGHLGCGMMRALIDVCGPARMPSEPSEDSGNPCRRFFYNVETFSTQAGNRFAERAGDSGLLRRAGAPSSFFITA